MLKTMERIVGLCKSRGFVYPGSEIYGGLANSWDYGPLGAQLKQNVKRAWWNSFVQSSPYNVGLDSAIIMNPRVWVASGHVGGFSDPLMDCRSCKERFRADKLIEEHMRGEAAEEVVDGWSDERMAAYIREKGVACPTCKATDFTDIRKFNLMFKTHAGVTEGGTNELYLRPETAQGIFVNFRNVQRTSRRKIPFGIAQVGKAFRNEITPGNFIFRTREFEQMELEFFCAPGTDDEWFSYWKKFCLDWLLSHGLSQNSLRMRDHSPEELSHYSNGTSDIEYRFPFGWGELWGIANRTDFDLKSHQEHSGEDMAYFDATTSQKYLPYCIEPSVGVDRLVLAMLCEAYDEEEVSDGDTRVVMRFHPAIAPIKLAVLPLSKKLSEEVEALFLELSKEWACEYDEAGSIGKRYRRQDEAGTPLCITFDFDSREDGAVTVRDRDTMEQERIPVAELRRYLQDRLGS